MKKVYVAFLLVLVVQTARPQNWQTTGNTVSGSSFLGTTNCYDLIFKTYKVERGRLTSDGIWRFGTSTNNAQFDASGNLRFYGNAAYRVPGNTYVFRYTSNLNYGLYFNSTVPQYEFRNGSAVPVFYVNADNGNGTFKGSLKIGNYTLPAADGASGQVLKTNGAGMVAWSNDNSGGMYTAGSGINISGNVISNTGDADGTDDANRFLSNLSAPTAVNQSLLPNAANTRDFGSAGLSWKDIYLAGALYLNGERYLANPAPGTGNILLGPNALAALTTGQHNVAIGANALAVNTTGRENTATGFNSLANNTTGEFNTAAGSGSLAANTTGSDNTATGVSALYQNTTGAGNTATGVNSLFYNTTGNSNTATGHYSLYANTTGSANTATGLGSLLANTTGNNNTAMGQGSLAANTTGTGNTATGSGSLSANTTGGGNTAVGTASLLSNTTGAQNTAAGNNSLRANTTGTFNTATGSGSLAANTTGGNNTAIGVSSLEDNTTGAYNTASGVAALRRNTTGNSNTAAGYNSLFSNTTGDGNTATGSGSLTNNTSGGRNTANGASGLSSNTTGSFNTATGHSSLFNNTTGSQNTAAGAYSLAANTTGGNNTAHGFNSLSSNSTGNFNTAAGSGSLFSNTAGSNNTATGVSSLYHNTTGISNTANGGNVLFSNTTGEDNTAVGYSSLYSNSTGSHNTASGVSSLVANITGNNNTATGHSSLASNTAGSGNTTFGIVSLASNTTGNGNSATGAAALYSNTTGNDNTATGHDALVSNATGSNNTAIGAFANVTTDGLENATAIGFNAAVDESNKVRIGNTAVTSIGGQVGWTTFSDGRFKRNIKENVQGLAFINSLRPVTYSVDIVRLNSHYRKAANGLTNTKNIQSPVVDNARFKQATDRASKIVETGFIAQEVEAAAKKLGYEFNGVDKPTTDDGLYGLRYDEFVVPLVKAVQEISTTVDAKDARIEAQQKQIDELVSRLNKLEALLSQCCASNAAQNGSSTSVVLNGNDGASLQQNNPNPFSRTTVISYTLPQSFSSAQMMITDKTGKALKQVKLEGAGKGRLQVDAATLAAGAYNYSLYVDGKLISSRQMVLAK